jgi:uncharacterized protein
MFATYNVVSYIGIRTEGLMKSPFVYGKIASGDKFTDRENEAKKLSDNIVSHINTVLISPRRWGKSSLVARVAEALEKTNDEVRFCFIDLFNVRTEQEFYTQFAREVLRVSFSRWQERLESAKSLFKQIKPKFTVGADPNVDFSIGFDWEEIRKTPQEILNLAETVSREKKIHIVVCIDEFQNVGFLENPVAFQKRLRAQWQHHEMATYVLYGSKRHMMAELFEHKAMPFYKFGEVFLLDKIREEQWISFITAAFKKSGKAISERLARQIAQKMENHPYFVQELAHTVWINTRKECTEREFQASLESLLSQYAILFQREVESLTNPQINFLKALCDNVPQLSASETLYKYQLGTSGNVNRIKTALVSKEVIDITPNRIEFIDPLFKAWFSAIYMKE